MVGRPDRQTDRQTDGQTDRWTEDIELNCVALVDKILHMLDCLIK